MVTLLGFFFILFNVGLLVIFMPDMVGPVRPSALDAQKIPELTL